MRSGCMTNQEVIDGKQAAAKAKRNLAMWHSTSKISMKKRLETIRRVQELPWDDGAYAYRVYIANIYMKATFSGRYRQKTLGNILRLKWIPDL